MAKPLAEWTAADFLEHEAALDPLFSAVASSANPDSPYQQLMQSPFTVPVTEAMDCKDLLVGENKTPIQNLSWQHHLHPLLRFKLVSLFQKFENAEPN